MEFYLNEVSLCGQYDTLQQFAKKEIARVYKCVELLKRYDNVVIVKMSELRNAKITAQNKVADLGSMQLSDELILFKIWLLQDACDYKDWDNEANLSQNLESKYFWNGEDVSLTSMAEAAESRIPLLSFERDGLVDTEVGVIKKNSDEFIPLVTQSIVTERYLVDLFGKDLGFTRNEMLKVRYQDTRLDFSLLEKNYDAECLEVEDYKNLINTCDKFISFANYNEIQSDKGLNYKAYSPDEKDKDPFSHGKYRNITIDKFRYSRKLRVFGYRDRDKFVVLRLERDHKMSDYG